MHIIRKFTFVFAIAIFGSHAAVAQEIGRSPVQIEFSLSPQNVTISEAQAMALVGLGTGFPDQQFLGAIGTTFNLHELFQETQDIFNERIIGYRPDSPRLVREEVQAAVITVQFLQMGLNGPLAFAGPCDTYDFQPPFNPFFTRDIRRPWVFTQTGEMVVNIDLIPFMLLTDEFVETIAHEAMHAIGFGSLFEANQLNGNSFFGNRVYNFNGFGLNRYRQEAQIPFASFIPLDNTAGHWDPNDPFFDQVTTGMRDVMHPFSAPPGSRIFFSETTWSVFADLGYLVSGVND